ncbi:MAG: hypothetical protein ACTHQ3_03895 [Motilibacteraceae bacterium]
MDDDLGVLGVVDAALAEGDVGLVRAEERVVAAVLVQAQLDLALVHRREGAAEAQGLQVVLSLGHPVVAHHLLELVGVPVVGREGAVHRLGRLPRAALHRDIAAGERAGGVEVGQGHGAVRVGERRRVRVVVIGEVLVAGLLHRVGIEDGAGGRARERAAGG